MSIYGNVVGGTSPLKTVIIKDESGNEYIGVVTESEVMLTAVASEDIRKGKVAVTDSGIVTGSAVIPNYETCAGQKIIRSGNKFSITLTVDDMYDYTELQCIICPFNSSINDSVAAERVVIDGNIYDARSTEIIATVTKNSESKTIDFNLTNTSDIPYIVRFFTYKELY